jgi:hypothetical protein
MKTLAHFLCAVLCLSAAAQDHASHVKEHPVTPVTGLGDLHHPVSTKNPSFVRSSRAGHGQPFILPQTAPFESHKPDEGS